METIFAITPIVLIWVAVLATVKISHEKEGKHRTRALVGRVVKLSKKVRKEEDLEEQYGRIVSVPEFTWKDGRLAITTLDVDTCETKEQHKEYAQKIAQATTKYEEEKQEYDLRCQTNQQFYQMEYQNQIYNGYNSAPKFRVPAKYDPVELTVNFKEVKLMPKNFDPISETVAKPLQPKGSKKKGGELKVRKMPRLFRAVIYLSVAIVVWSVCWNIASHVNDIATFGVHTFLHR